MEEGDILLHFVFVNLEWLMETIMNYKEEGRKETQNRLCFSKEQVSWDSPPPPIVSVCL